MSKTSGNVGKVQLVNATAPSSTRAGFHCATCDATFASYDVYLDHTHSRVHIRNVQAAQGQVVSGVLQVERIEDPQRIRDRLAWLKKRKAEKEASITKFKEDPKRIVEERLEAQRQAIETAKKEKRHKRKSAKDENENVEELDEEAKLMASVMGITAFK